MKTHPANTLMLEGLIKNETTLANVANAHEIK